MCIICVKSVRHHPIVVLFLFDSFLRLLLYRGFG